MECLLLRFSRRSDIYVSPRNVGFPEGHIFMVASKFVITQTPLVGCE